jgi:hypothetical protein
MYKQSSTYTISTRLYLDAHTQQYINILVINMVPNGPLQKYVSKIKMPRLSPFQQQTGCCATANECVYAIKSLFIDVNNYSRNLTKCHLMCDVEIPDLFSFLISNNYKIDTSLTKMMNTNPNYQNINSKLICFVSYSEK